MKTIETHTPQEARLVEELDKMLSAIHRRDWANANHHRQHVSVLVKMLGERGKEIQREHGDAAKAERDNRLG